MRYLLILYYQKSVQISPICVIRVLSYLLILLHLSIADLETRYRRIYKNLKYNICSVKQTGS